MKKFKIFIMAALASLMFTACQDNDLSGSGGSAGNQQNEGEGVYMGLTVQMPGLKGSRSETIWDGQSNDGTEVGTDGENKVDNVLIVVAKSTDNSFIVAGEVTSDGLKALGAANSYKTTVKMQKTNLNDYYDTEGFTPEVNVFVFCNPTADLLTEIKACDLGNTGWFDLACNLTPSLNTGIWKDGSFLMSNVSIATRELPAKIEYWDSYKTEGTAFDFSGDNLANQQEGVDNSATNGRGAIAVQRTVARLDFKDGSQDAADKSGKANTYNVIKNTAGKTIIQVELNRMLLTNMSNKFYYLPRVSADGKGPGSLCGAETPTNYLVGPYWETFQNGFNISSKITNYGDYLNYPFFTESKDYNTSGWDNYLINDVLKGADDNYEGPDHNDKEYQPGTYKVWRYVTENVIPGEPNDQTNGISTGVVFKGRFIPTSECNKSKGEEGYDKYLKDMYDYVNGVDDDHKLTGNPYTDPIIYQFNGAIYFTWENLREQAISNSVVFENETDDEGKNTDKLKITNINRSEPLYRAVFGDGGLGTFMYNDIEYTDPDNLPVSPTSANSLYLAWAANKVEGEAWAKFQEKIVDGEAHMYIYQTSNDDNDGIGYYCYYFYWNRHNDNGRPGIMGPMEFATVRNNVYKLAVTGIRQLGHPRIKNNDPDPAEPDTPDESDDIYLTVTCEVVPWVVRLNNIEF